MKKRMIMVLTLFFIFSFFQCNIVYANNGIDIDDRIIVTEEMAVAMAENFGNAIVPDLELSASNPQKFYDINGQAIGYIVSFYNNNNIPNGYIIFDSTTETVITEYSIEEAVCNPYEVSNSEYSSIHNVSSNDIKLCKTEPFTYEFVESTTIYDVDNRIESSDCDASEIFSSKPSTEWDYVLLKVNDVYADYNLSSFNHLTDFTYVTQNEATRAAGHFACAIQALRACSMQYGIYENIVGQYNDLWIATGTTTTRVDDGGVVYGSTNDSNIGPGFVNYCSGKGISISQTTQLNADYNFYKNCIDNGDPAVICASITRTSTGEVSNHAVAVEGYATIENKYTGTTLRTLWVADGWHDYARHLLFDSNSFTKKTGIAFSS